MKICKDCRWVSGSLLCNSPNNVSLVTGAVAPKLAEAVRNDNSKCGLEGRWFESPLVDVPAMPSPLPLAK